MLLVAATMTISFATSSSQNDNCGARVALVLDRSSSIGVDQFSGGRAQSVRNIDAIKVGANNLVDALKGKDSYTDVYGFATLSHRLNTGDWFNIKDQDHANWQKLVIGGSKFKQGATSTSEKAYPDGMNAAGEGLTNWEHALYAISSSHLDGGRKLPTHIVFFTDGNPTTNIEHTLKALQAGGSFTKAGFPNEDGTHAPDIDRALFRALWFHMQGVKIIPIAVGAESIVNMKNLQGLAGAGNPVYRSSSYGDLTNMFLQAAQNICKPEVPKSRLSGIVKDITDPANPKYVPATLDTLPTGQIQVPGNGSFGHLEIHPKENFNARVSIQRELGANGRYKDYELKNSYCRIGPDWSTNSPVTGAKSAGGQIIDVNGMVPGQRLWCEFVIAKKFVPQDGIELTKTVNPTKAKRGEAVTYSFVVKNTGNTVLKNIKVNDPMLGGVVGTIAELAPGASSSPITKQYTIPNNATGSITNTATAEGTPYDKDGKPRPVVKDTDDAVVEIELRSGQVIEKTVTPSVARVGQEVTYTIAVRNTGETTLSNVVVNDVTLGREVTVAGPIAPGNTGTVQIKYTIKASDFDNGVFKNIACIKGTQTCDDAKVTEPKINLTKSGPSVAKPGQKVTFTFVVENTGKTDLTDHVITDETLSKYTDEPVEIKVPGTLKPGEKSDEIEYEFTIPRDFEGDRFVNVAVVKATPIDPETGDKVPGSQVTDRDDHTIDLIRWEATKTADKSSTVPGGTVTYTITVKNTGAAALTNFEVSDPTINFPEDGNPEIIDVLLPGESKSITVEYTIPVDYEGNTFKNTALVCLPFEGQDDDCEEPEVTVSIARIAITKTADKERAIPGETVTYTFVVKNTGGVTLEPTDVYDSVLGVIGNPGTLEPGESATLTKEFVVPQDTEDGAEIVNIATVCAPVPGAGEDESLSETDCETTCPAETEATVCDQDDHILVVDIPSIAIVKSADVETANVGDIVTYTFVVTNTSNVTLFDIEVIDNVLGDLGTIDKLEPGQSAEKTVEYEVQPEAAEVGFVRNVVTACFTTPEWEDNCATDDHELTVVEVGGEVVERPEPPAVGSAQLPFTGSSNTWLASLAAILLGVGTVLIMAARRKKSLA